jgi:hypothetical protein
MHDHSDTARSFGISRLELTTCSLSKTYYRGAWIISMMLPYSSGVYGATLPQTAPAPRHCSPVTCTQLPIH